MTSRRKIAFSKHDANDFGTGLRLGKVLEPAYLTIKLLLVHVRHNTRICSPGVREPVQDRALFIYKGDSTIFKGASTDCRSARETFQSATVM